MNLTRWAWLILPLGVCRATQIVLWDRITQGPRRWLLRHLNPEGYGMRDERRGYLAYLLECPWCMSIWLAALAVVLTWWGSTRQATLLVLLVLALSLIAVGIDHAYDRWLPDEPPQAETGIGAFMEQNAGKPYQWGGLAPPEHVADAFNHLTGDDTTEPT